jgi:hypothetical protein
VRSDSIWTVPPYDEWLRLATTAAGISDSTAGVIIAAITALIVSILGLIGTGAGMLFKLFQQGRNVAEIRENVVNDHPKNLRAEQDERHGENSTRLVNLERQQTDTLKALNRIEDHLGIEQTIPRPLLRSRGKPATKSRQRSPSA